METQKQPEQMREIKMPGNLVADDGQVFWRLKADKVAFTDRSGQQRHQYVVESVEQGYLFRVIGRQYSAYAVWQALKSCLVLETGLVHVTQAVLAQRASLRPAQVSKAMALLRQGDLVRDMSGANCDLRGMALNPDLVIIGDHGRARRLWERGVRAY
jgi:hypothetical protein